MISENLFGADYISNAAQSNVKHVFVITNPINTIVVRMLINRFCIENDDILIFSMRGTDTTLVGPCAIAGSSTLFDRALMKFFNFSGQGLRFKKFVEQDKRKFILYASWMYPEIEVLAKSHLCLGSVYIEEGQQSYYLARAYPASNNSWSKRKEKILGGSVDYYFRNDHRACVGLGANAFPLMDSEKKIVLKEFELLKKCYLPQLSGKPHIGVTPAPRRIPENQIFTMARVFANILPDGGVVKLHPGFNVHQKMARIFKEELKRASLGKVKCAPNSTIIELEMLFEQKFLFGPRSSISIYAEIFNCEYQTITFSGYIDPLN